jgi:hypothetical protein
MSGRICLVLSEINIQEAETKKELREAYLSTLIIFAVIE